MTTKNAILMIVKQGNGIEFNALLNKLASSYSNINSARAALSRSLKDLVTFGFLEKKNGRIMLLPKGEAEIYSAVKNKLVLNLNASMKHKRPAEDIGPIVEKLQTLIERARQDRDLLKTSKGSLDFTISDLEKVKSDLEAHTKHLAYLSKVFGDQISSLKDMDFHDSHEKPLDKDSLQKLSLVFDLLSDSEFTVECQNQQVLQILADSAGVKPKEKSFSMPKIGFTKFVEFVEANKAAFSEPPITVFSSVLKAQFHFGKVSLSGPYPEIQKWRQ